MDDKKIETIQKNLRQIRTLMGISALELGEMLGVRRQTINNIESYRYGKISKLKAIAIYTVLKSCVLHWGYDKETISKVLKLLGD